MSEVQSRPSAPRGRGSARGGRGGLSSRGRGGRGHATNGDKFSPDTDGSASIEDDGEVAQLKKQYGSSVGTLKELFPDWTDEDIVFALQETNGDLETAVDRITNGSITQWGEVSKTKKDRSKSKVKDAASVSLTDSTNQPRGSRGGRAGFEGGRGGRGRGTERGRGGGRGGRGASVAHTNGSRKENSESLPPAAESSAWDTPTATDDTPAWDTPKPAEETSSTSQSSHPTAKAAVKAASSIIPEGVKKSWASMFAPAPAPKKEKAPEPSIEKHEEPPKAEEPVVPPSKEVEVVESPPTPIKEKEATPVIDKAEPVEIAPSKDDLTETNLEQLPDTSGPAPTATAASTAASSWDPRNATNTSTPYSTTEQTPAQAVRPPPTSGFQASALKATGASGRSASYQRRVLDQEEAVRMPGNREVDRAAVQFGAFNLGAGEEDVDGEREDAETRAQPPSHSPVAPRASLPPAPQQTTASASETLPTPKQSTVLPTASQPNAAPGLPSPAPLSSAPGATSQTAGQFGRYEQPAREQSSAQPKSYDAFNQQNPTQSPFEGYSNQQSQSQQPQVGGFSSAPGEFSSYYTANEQQRQAYNNYYQQYGTPGQQEGPGSQQRGYGGYGPQSDGSGQFPQSGAQAPSRYATAGEGQNSGHNTPNPTAQGQQQSGQSGQPQPGHHQPQGGAYPYGSHPYYNSPYYAAYMNQYQQYGGNYNAPYGGKAGIHQQPYQGYGMSPGAPYDHSSSPAGGAFGGSSLHGRDSALSGGLSDYGRGTSAQSAQNQQSIGGNGAFGASHDSFARNSGFQGQGGYNTQQANPQGSTDDLKPFGESKNANGPSPSLAHTGRPGSATNTTSGSGLPPPQSQQGGYGGYPHQGHGVHGNQGNSQYSGVGGAGGHQAGQGHQNSPYGGYGGFGGYGGGYGNSQQQRGGWGGNYGH